MAEFEVDIDRWIAGTKERLKNGKRAIAEGVLERVKEHTPVKTGRLRAAWALEQDGDDYRVSNNIEYAARVNFGFTGTDSLGRHYDQNGAHMVEQTLAEIDDIAKKALDNLS